MSSLIKYRCESSPIKRVYMCDNCLLVLTEENLPVYRETADDSGTLFIPRYCMRCGVKFDSVKLQDCN